MDKRLLEAIEKAKNKMSREDEKRIMIIFFN